MKFRICGIGAWGNGFTNWEQLRALILGETVEGGVVGSSKGPKPELIPANERRRAPLTARVAVEVSHQAVLASMLDAQSLPCIFGSGYGDTAVTDYMCRVLNSGDKQLSPTKFHNSVHNAPAGYWTISTGCRRSANSIAALDYTAGMALLEAVTQCHSEQEPVLLTLFDVPVVEVLHGLFPSDSTFAISLVIEPAGAKHDDAFGVEVIDRCCLPGSEELGLNSELTKMYQTNPSAKILPMFLHYLKRPLKGDMALPLSKNLGLSIRYEH